MSSFLDCMAFGAYPGVSKEKGLSRARIAHYIKAVHDYGTNVIAALEAYETPSGWTSPDELKFDACLSLVHGAKGIMWYNYYQARKRPELLNAIFEISRLLNGPELLGEVFLRGKDNHNIQATITGGPKVFMDGFTSGMKRSMPNNPSLHWRAYNHRGNIYIVMANCCELVVENLSKVNIEPLTIEVEFQNIDPDSKIILLDGKSKYNFQSGKLTVTAKPLGVAIFKISP